MSKESRIFSICVVKNEADIIAHCLTEASKWSDRVFVYDGESTDGTWEAVLAMRNDKIVPWKQHDKPFSEGLRAEVYNAHRQEAREGDWWCRLDADEVYVSDPRAVLARTNPPYHVVWGVAIEYYLTKKDVETIDFTRPMDQILESLRFYRATNSEPRFFRHRNGLLWSPEQSWPRHMGLSFRERVAYRHYKYRSPTQIQRRLETRQVAIERGFGGWWAQAIGTWLDRLADPSTCKVDHKDGNLLINDSDLPDHLGNRRRRAIQWLMHTFKLWP